MNELRTKQTAPVQSLNPHSSESPERSRLSRFALPALLIILTVVAYSQVFTCGFIEVYDDEEYITKNAMVLQGLTWHGLNWSLTTFLTGNWHPLTWWSHMADVSIFGLNPAGHHAINLLLHAINALLLYYFLLKTSGLRGRSFLVAALFAIHPLHVESVAWVAERKDLLSTACGLIALHCYVKYVQTHRGRMYLALFLVFCLGLMAKPMLVTLPFLLLLLDYWPLERFRTTPFATLLREKLPLLIPVAVASFLTLLAQRSVGAISDKPMLERLYAGLYSYLIYLKKLAAPYDLTAFYPYRPVGAAQAVGAAVIVAAISAWVYRARRSSPWLVVGWLWFLGMLIPVIGIIKVGAQAYADRYTYLSSVGICIMAVWSGAELVRKSEQATRIGVCVVTVVIGIYSGITWRQTGFWRNGDTLYARDLAVIKGNWHANMNLGTMLVERKQFDEGIKRYKEALLNAPPSVANIYYNLGMAYEQKGDRVEAEKYYRMTVSHAPRRDSGYLGLARILSSSGDTAGALAVIRGGMTHAQDTWLLLAKEAYLLHKAGDTVAAERVYRQAITKEPYAAENYINLGILFAQQGNMAELQNVIDRLRRINPAEADNLVRLLR